MSECPGRPRRIRLAVYGSLAPGRVNHDELAELEGAWTQGVVRGRLVSAGWGAALGFPGLVLDPEGDKVAVFLFTSPALPEHWARLDAFEGPAYRRAVADVTTADEVLPASIYVLAV